MTEGDFFEFLLDVLQCPEPISRETVLVDMAEWDSLAFMLVLAFFDKELGITATFDDLNEIRTVADLVDLAQGGIQ